MILYRLFDADDVLLYVGITAKFASRLKNHERAQPWWSRVDHHTVEIVPAVDARRAERRAIYDEAPLFNKIGVRQTYEAKDDPLDEWGANIRAARAAAGLTQFELSKLMGVASMTVTRWEADADQPRYRCPSVETQVRLAQLLGRSVTAMFPRTERERALGAMDTRLSNTAQLEAAR
jgi:DNA-binding XRE family transcriptional regulator